MPDEVEDDVENGISEGENGKGSERGPGSASWPFPRSGRLRQRTDPGPQRNRHTLIVRKHLQKNKKSTRDTAGITKHGIYTIQLQTRPTPSAQRPRRPSSAPFMRDQALPPFLSHLPLQSAPLYPPAQSRRPCTSSRGSHGCYTVASKGHPGTAPRMRVECRPSCQNRMGPG